MYAFCLDVGRLFYNFFPMIILLACDGQATPADHYVQYACDQLAK
jgi:hypothetical protein